MGNEVTSSYRHTHLKQRPFKWQRRMTRSYLIIRGGGGGGGADTLEATSIQMAAQNEVTSSYMGGGGGGGLQTLWKQRPFKWQYRMKLPRHTYGWVGWGGWRGVGGGGADTFEATSVQMAAQNEVTSSKGRAVLTTMLGRK